MKPRYIKKIYVDKNVKIPTTYTFYMCDVCGCPILNELMHDRWHEYLDNK